MERLLGSDISRKPGVVKLEVDGVFGNKIKTWSSIADLQADDYRGLVAIRYKVPDRQFMRYHIPFDEVPQAVAEFKKRGAHEDLMWFNEMGPHSTDKDRMFQGEVMRSERYIDLFYATTNKVMRLALVEDGQHASGILAVRLLRENMEASAYEDLQSIWDWWPNAVVEFTTWGLPVGGVVGRRTNFRRQTTFWEVREY